MILLDAAQESYSMAYEAGRGVLYVWPVTVAIGLLLIVGALATVTSEKLSWMQVLRWTLVLCALPLVIVASGAFWASVGAPDIPLLLWIGHLLSLETLEVVVCVVAVGRVREARILISGIALMSFWYSLWCFFMAVVADLGPL